MDSLAPSWLGRDTRCKYLPDEALNSEGWDGFKEWLAAVPYKEKHGKLYFHTVRLALLGLGLLIRDAKVGIFGEEELYPEDLPEYIRFIKKLPQDYTDLCALSTSMLESISSIVPKDPFFHSVASGSGSRELDVTPPVEDTTQPVKKIRHRPTGPKKPVVQPEEVTKQQDQAPPSEAKQPTPAPEPVLEAKKLPPPLANQEPEKEDSPAPATPSARSPSPPPDPEPVKGRKKTGSKTRARDAEAKLPNASEDDQSGGETMAKRTRL